MKITIPFDKRADAVATTLEVDRTADGDYGVWYCRDYGGARSVTPVSRHITKPAAVRAAREFIANLTQNET